MNATRDEFESKAPLVDYDELVDIATQELLTDELRRKTAGVWITGSFVNPEKPLDTGESPSDLDLLVPVHGWEYPITSSGIAFAAPQVDIPDAYGVTDVEWESVIPSMVEETVTDADPQELPKIGTWDSPIEEVWEKLPQYVCTTLERSIKHGFYARESDVESEIIRTYDVVIGPLELFDLLYDQNADKMLQLWENDDTDAQNV